eukprot:424182-Rhodomonas_salina.1
MTECAWTGSRRCTSWSRASWRPRSLSARASSSRAQKPTSSFARAQVPSALCPRARYAMSGTDAPAGATRESHCGEVARQWNPEP